MYQHDFKMYQCIIYQYVCLLLPYHAWPLRAADSRPCSSFHFALCDAWNHCPMMHNDPWHWRCLIDLLQNGTNDPWFTHLPLWALSGAWKKWWRQHGLCMSLWILCEHLPIKATRRNRLAFCFQSCFRFSTLPYTRWSKAKLRLGQATTTSSTSHWWTCCNSMVEK